MEALSEQCTAVAKVCFLLGNIWLKQSCHAAYKNKPMRTNRVQVVLSFQKR